MRPSKDEVFLAVARVLATRSTCARRQVGCVLVDVHGHVAATGYNGTAAGLPNCTETPCAVATSPSGTDLDLCEAIHAEQNALLQCRDVQSLDVCYVTCSPCLHCLKMLLNTSVRRICFIERYQKFEGVRHLWVEVAGRELCQGTSLPLALGDELLALVDKVSQ